MNQPSIGVRWLVDDADASTSLIAWRDAISESCGLVPNSTGTDIQIVFASGPPAGEEVLNDVAKRVVWVDESCETSAWLAAVTAWRPWRVLTQRMMGEGVELWPEQFRHIALWMPPLVRRCAQPAGGAGVRDRVLLVRDGKRRGATGVLSQDRAGKTEAWLESTEIQEVLRDASIDSIEAELLIHRLELLDEGRVRGLVIGVREPMLAHVLWRIAASRSLPCANLLCSAASLVRGMPDALVAGTSEKRADSLRAQLAPLLRWGAVIHDERAGDLWSITSADWIDGLLAEAAGSDLPGDLLGWANRMLRSNDSPVSCLSDCLWKDRISVDSPGAEAAGRLFFPSVQMFLREWPRNKWTADFAAHHARVPNWFSKCREAGALNAADERAADSMGRVALGIFEGVCEGFASGWRADLLIQAVDLWKSDREARRISVVMRCEEMKARAALKQCDEVDRLLEAQTAWPAGHFHQLTWFCLREIMPEIEANGYSPKLLNQAFTAMRNWLEAEPASESSNVAGFWAVLDAYAGEHESAIARLACEKSGAWNAGLGIWLWVLKNEAGARLCLDRASGYSGGSPAVTLSIAALHALVGSVSEAVVWVGRLYAIAPRYGARIQGPPDTRWLCLGLCMKALGQIEQAALLRERALAWHPHGQLRDAQFDRVTIRNNVVAIPHFDTE